MLTIPTDLIIDRIKDSTTLTDVKLALSFSLPTFYPSAYVFLIAEHPERNQTIGKHFQKITGIVGIELMVQHFEESTTGGPSALLLDDLRMEVMTALMGWAPTSEFSPFNFFRGDLISFNDGYAVWRDQYSTDFYR